MKKIIIYTRTSTGPEEKQIQLQQQDIIMDYIKKRNEAIGPAEQLELIEIFQEVSTSSNHGREVFNQMIDSIEKWHFDELIACDESRLARNPEDINTLNELLNDWYFQNIRIVSNNRLYTKEHPML